METTPTGIVLEQIIQLFHAVHTIATIITTTTTIVALPCLQTLIIQTARAVGHVTLVSSRSTTCVFGGINFSEYTKKALKRGLFYLLLSRFLYTTRVARNMSGPLVVIYGCVLSQSENLCDPHYSAMMMYEFKDYFFIFLLCLSSKTCCTTQYISVAIQNTGLLP